MTGTLAVTMIEKAGLTVRLSDDLPRKILLSPRCRVTPEVIAHVQEHRERIVMALTPVEDFPADVTIWDCYRHRPWDERGIRRATGRILPDPEQAVKL